MDGAFSGELDVREAAQQPLADLASTPAGMLVLHIENVVLHLKRELVSIAIRTTATIGETLHTALLVAVEDLVAGLAGNAELAAQLRHRLTSESASHELESFIHYRTLLPRHPLPPRKRKKVSPM